MTRQTLHNARLHRTLKLAALATIFQFGGCDPTIRATLEEGIIDISTSALTAFFQAGVNLIAEAQAEGTTPQPAR